MNFYTRKRRVPTVIIISLIDIFAILLIFVIVTTTFKRAQPAVVIKLPESTSAAVDAPSKEVAPTVVSISSQGEVFLDAQAVSLDKLAQALAAVVSDGRSIALNADTKAPFGVIVRVLDALKEAGVKGNLPAFTERKGN